ncbi:MAG: hypothetical protein ACI9S8_000919 [Chlamydiales bacterium]|jgi:hypothetical protein
MYHNLLLKAEYFTVFDIYPDMKDLFQQAMDCREDTYNPVKREKIDCKINQMLEKIDKMIENKKFGSVKGQLCEIQGTLRKMKGDNLKVLCNSN